MRSAGRWVWALVAVSGLLLVGCGEGDGLAGVREGGSPDAGTQERPEVPDAGPTTPDAGRPDAGPPDAGPPDAGPPDAGPVVTVELPSREGWTFYGTQHGGPTTVYGVSADEGGNLWVAGGEEGLFVLEKGQERFRRFTLADGLRPYGYLPDGGVPVGEKKLKVISVAGGPAGTAFVGYEGIHGAGAQGCEANWDNHGAAVEDPNIYKSGDADRVTLTQDGIRVAHYDIYTGPGKIDVEPRGRERICDVLRIAYDPTTRSVWFGGNHGFAWGDADWNGTFTCNPSKWEWLCNGGLEHVHPAINAWNDTNTSTVLLTDAYYGIAPKPDGDVYFGGAIRSTVFHFATRGYWKAQTDTEAAESWSNRWDLWKDPVQEPFPSGVYAPNSAGRKMQEDGKTVTSDDHVSGMSLASDGSVWVGSFVHGLAHVSPTGEVLREVREGLIAPHVRGVAVDPIDDSVWAGARWGGGVSRVDGNTLKRYGPDVFGQELGYSPVADIQVDRSGDKRRILVGFEGYTRKDGTRVPGAIGIYSGN